MDAEFGQEEAAVSWSANPKKAEHDEEDGDDGIVEGVTGARGPVLLEAIMFKDDAKEIGVVEVTFFFGGGGRGCVFLRYCTGFVVCVLCIYEVVQSSIVWIRGLPAALDQLFEQKTVFCIFILSLIRCSSALTLGLHA